jgi:hypothetical protein
MSKFDKYQAPKNIDRDRLSNQSSSVFDKYRAPKVVQKETSPSFFDRLSQFGKGALSGFSRAAMSEAADQAGAGVMDVGGIAVPISESSALANIPQKGIESLEAMKPRKNDSLGNILYKAGEFGGGVASFPMMPGAASAATGARSLLSPLAKEFGKGAVIGTGSGMLQEGGVDPLAADLASTFLVPGSVAAAKAPINFFSKFTPKARKANLEKEVGDLFRERVGEKNLPTVLQKLNNEGSPLNTNLTTAELAENAGLAGLHRAIAPNIPAIAERNVANNMLIRKNLEELGNTNVTPEITGESIRNRLAKNLNTAIKERVKITDPLYKKLEELQTGVKLPLTEEFLKNRSKYAKGDIKKNLKYVQDVLKSNNTNKKELTDFNKKYANLSPQIRSQLEEQITGLPLPIEVVNARKDITGRIGANKRAGNYEIAKVLTEAEKNILADMAAIPEEQIARYTYDQLSKPVSAIEKEPLLSKFVKKDVYEKEFLLSPEKIPDMILSGSLNNTKALMKQIGDDPKTLEILRGGVVNKLLNSTELSSGEKALSFDKMNKFLKKNKAKLELIFDDDQIKILGDVREILKKRNMVATLGRAAGSNTQSETTLLNSLFDTASSKLLRDTTAYAIPGGGIVYDTIRDFFKNSKNAAKKDLIEKALLDPETAKLLLTPTKNIKDKETLVSMLERIYGRPLAASGMMAANREGQ